MKQPSVRFLAALKLRIISSILLVLAGTPASDVRAASSPGGLSFLIGTTNGPSGGQVLVPVRVNQFNGISSFQFSIHWNSTIATYVGVEQFGLQGLASGNFGTTSAGNGTLTVSWDDPDALSKSLPDGVVMFFVRLQLTGSPGATSSVTIDGAPTAIEVANENLETIPVTSINGQLSIDQVNTPPVITTQPQSQTALIGNTVTFSIVATGTLPLNYQWRLNGTNLSGAVAPALTLTNAQQSQAGDYTIVVTNIAGSVTSVVAHLTVNVPADSAAPVIVINSPTINMTYATSNNSITLGGAASDNVGVTQVTWSSDRGGSGLAAGTTTWTVPVIGLQAGTNVLTVRAHDAAGNTGTASLRVAYTPPAGASRLTFTVGTAHGQPSALVLVPVQVNQFNAISSFQFSLHWNSMVASYAGVEQFALPGLSAGSFGATMAGGGTLTVSWDDPDGLSKSAPDGTVLFFVRLQLIGAPLTASAVTIDGTPTALEAANADLLPIPVDVIAGLISIDTTNTPPTISAIGTQSTLEDTPVGPIGFLIGDQQSPPAILELTGLSSNPALIPPSNIVFGGSDSNRSVTLTPALNQSGSATITVVVFDGLASASNNFLLTVTAVNDAPVISDIGNQLTMKNQPTPDIPFVVGDVETSAAALTLTAGSSNSGLVPASNILLGGGGSNRTVRITPASNQVGSAIITITVSDGQLSATNRFTLTVQEPVNVTNLVGYWRFDETSGALTLDSSGTNIGTLVNGPVRMPGRFGGALNFDGINDYVNIADSNSLDLSNRISISLWFKPGQLLNALAGRKDLLKKLNSYWLILGYPDSDGRLAFVLNSGSPLVKGTTSSWQSNQWSHAVATYDGLQMKIYVNGVCEGTVATTVPAINSNSPLQIGGNSDFGIYFPGCIDDVRIYNTALSSNEVWNLFSAPPTIQTNMAPLLAPIANQTLIEGTALTFTASALDTDTPSQTLSYSLAAGAPAGASMNATNGVFTWTPSEAQGPSTNSLAVVVRDNGSPSMSATQFFTITVLESNSPPMLLPIGDRVAQVLLPLRITNVVIDADLPTNHMTFLLTEGPKGVHINKFTGTVGWVPTRDQAKSTNVITVIVTDDGDPPLSATNTFRVTVGDYVELGLGSTVIRAGQPGSVFIDLLSSTGITNLSSLLLTPDDRLANLRVTTLDSEFGPGTLTSEGPDLRLMTFATTNGQIFQGSRLLGQLNFTSISTQSAFVPLILSNVMAWQTNGVQVGRTLADSGRVVIVGNEPLLEALLLTNMDRALILYGEPGTNYVVQSTSEFSLSNSNRWQIAWQGALTNLFQTIQPATDLNGTVFFRVLRQ